MLRSLRFRLAIFFTVPVLVAGGLVLVLGARSVSSYQRAQTIVRLHEQGPGVARIFADKAVKFLTDPRPGEINLSNEIRTVVNARVYFTSNPAAGFDYPGGNVAVWHGLRLDWARINRGEAVVVDATPPGATERYVVVASGIFLGNNHRPSPGGSEDAIGAIALARPASSLGPSGGFWARRLLGAALVGVAVAVLLGLIFGWRLARPLRRLVAATEAIAAGSYDVRLDRKRRDEIGQLNRAFGAMAGQLSEAREHERQFLMRVSHELRTPLTAIRGHVAALADGVIEEQAERDSAYEVIGTEIGRLERLIRDLLDLARLEARRFTLRREEVDLAVLLETCRLGHLQAAREAGIDLESDVDDVGILIGDGDRILQVVGNLVDNALRWTPAGGTVRLAARRRGDRVLIAVIDSGPGVPADGRADIFRPFHTGDDHGTGLGLAIAAELAAAMGGSVVLDDNPGGGARFTVALPSVAARSGGVLVPTA